MSLSGCEFVDQLLQFLSFYYNFYNLCRILSADNLQQQPQLSRCKLSLFLEGGGGS